MVGPNDIRIADLAHPVQTDALRAAHACPPEFPSRLSADDVLARARDATGLSNFGEDTGFKDRLAIILRAVDEDEGLTAGGRATIGAHAIRVMANRLRIEDTINRHPEILDIEIDRPIFIAGLPRSGTTHLVNWLSRDDRLRSLTLWESEEPVSTAPVAADGVDPRVRRSEEYWRAFMAMVPHLPAMHPMDAHDIHEDNELLFMDMNCYNWEWISRIPRWIDHYLAHDRTVSYAYEKKVLQLLTWQRGPNRWLLKSPQHMENLAAIRAVFPDARMVITHRDPVAVLKSLLTMVSYTDRVRRDPVDPPGAARLWIDRIERLLRACIDQRDGWPASQSRDVLFHEYMADQAGTAREIYAMADLELTSEVEAKLLGYLAENPRHAHGRVIYDLKADFGVDEAALRERFAFYYNRFPVRQEV